MFGSLDVRDFTVFNPVWQCQVKKGLVWSMFVLVQIGSNVKDSELLLMKYIRYLDLPTVTCQYLNDLILLNAQIESYICKTSKSKISKEMADG